MTIQIRPATQTDLPEVARLFDLYRQFYEQPADAALALDFITQRWQKKESVILVAQAKGESALSGFCQLYPSFCSVLAKPIYVLYDLFVQPDARQSGAGRLLMQAAEARALADGKARMDLTTAKDNLRAQALYESCGWQRDEIFYAYNKTLPSP